MSQWSEVQKLEPRFLEQVDQFYDDSFPMDIRHLLAEWIEKQDWDAASNSESKATILLQKLLLQVDEQHSRAIQENNLVLRHRLNRIRLLLQRKYQCNPMHMAVVVASCLREERRVVAAARMPVQGPFEKSLQNTMVSDRQRMVEHQVTAIKNSAQVTEQDVKYLDNLQDEFDFRYKTLQSRENGDNNCALVSQNVNEEVLHLQEMLNVLDHKRKEALSKMTQIIKEMDILTEGMLVQELTDWKRRQQIACIGGPLHNGLDQLQNWFTLLAESLFQVRRQLEKLAEMQNKITYEEDPIPLQRPFLQERINFLIDSLLRSSFIVERQPTMSTQPQRPLVLKTGVQFNAKVRLLIKLPELNYQLRVKGIIDKDTSSNLSRRFVLCGTYTKVMNMDESANGSLSAEFQHLKTKENKCNSGNKGNEGSQLVTDELHLISFETQVELYGITIALEASSLPLVIISGVSQLPNAWASIMWYNLCTSDPQNLTFLSNPPTVPLSQLLEVLSWQFLSYVGLGLDADQMNMLGGKMLGQPIIYSDVPISWGKFCKEHLPGKTFSFWSWLEAILELIKKHLLPLWIDGHIMGFVSKEKERALLKSKSSGTFLLRFSESCLGGITFTWVNLSENAEDRLHSVIPYNKVSLNALPFADILRDYKVIEEDTVPQNPLKYLYPDIPKDKAFSKHYNSQAKEDSSPPIKGPYVPAPLTPVSKIPQNNSQTSCSLMDLLPLSLPEYKVLREDLSPLEIELAMSSPFPSE